VDGEEEPLQGAVYAFGLPGGPGCDGGDGREAEDQGKYESLECRRPVPSGGATSPF
jgi:hypothetical protein